MLVAGTARLPDFAKIGLTNSSCPLGHTGQLDARESGRSCTLRLSPRERALHSAREVLRILAENRLADAGDKTTDNAVCDGLQ